MDSLGKFDFVDRQRALHFLCVTPATLNKLCRQGHIRTYRLPSQHRRFNVQDLRSCLERAVVKPKQTDE